MSTLRWVAWLGVMGVFGVISAQTVDAQSARGSRGGMRSAVRGTSVVEALRRAERLDLSEEQVASLEQLQEQQIQARRAREDEMREFGARVRSGDITIEEVRELREERGGDVRDGRELMSGQLGEILNEDQMQSLRQSPRGSMQARRGGARAQRGDRSRVGRSGGFGFRSQGRAGFSRSEMGVQRGRSQGPRSQGIRSRTARSNSFRGQGFRGRSSVGRDSVRQRSGPARPNLRRGGGEQSAVQQAPPSSESGGVT